MMRQFNAPVVFNQAVSQGWKLLAFLWPQDLAPPIPGQFFTFNPQGLQAGNAGLLRRPLAFAFYGRGLAFALTRSGARLPRPWLPLPKAAASM